MVKPFFLLLFAGAMAVAPVRADVVVLANRTAKTLRCDVAGADQAAKLFAIAADDLVTISVRCPAVIEFASGGKTQRFELQADAAYYFHTSRTSDDPELDQIGLGGDDPPAAGAFRAADRPRPANVPNDDGEQPPAATVKIAVKLLADDDERAARPLWEKRLRKRFEAAAEVIERHCPVKFEIIAVEIWESNDEIDEFAETLVEFERLVDPHPARVAIGFTSQYRLSAGSEHAASRGPLCSHVLLPERSQQVSEPELRELLVHELGHFLGAAHSAERNSVMRPRMADRQALASGFRIGFDPLNTLAMALVVEELREHGLKSLFDVGPRRSSRLAEIYSTLMLALPADSSAADYLGRLEPSASAALKPDNIARTRGARRPAAENRPTADDEGPQRSARVAALVQGTQTVLESIAAAALRNSQLAAEEDEGDEPIRLTGDELTEFYVRKAANAADGVAAEQRTMALFLALAIGLDRSDKLRKYAVLGKLVEQIEPDERRERRLDALGKPTMRGRYDLTQHFMISAAIAMMAGDKSAEAVGLAKELSDSQGGTGFSFVDWCADLAGIALAQRVRANEISAASLATTYQVDRFLPKVDGLPEGLTRAEFTRQYGSTDDPRFRRLDAEIRRRVEQLYEADGARTTGRTEE